MANEVSLKVKVDVTKVKTSLDNVQKAFNEIDNVLKKIGKKTNLTEFKKTLDDTKKSLDDLMSSTKNLKVEQDKLNTSNSNTSNSNKDLKDSYMGITIAIGSVVLVLQQLARTTSDVATEFERQMRNVNSLLQESEVGFQKLSIQIRDISKLRYVSDTATGVSKAMYQLATSGFDVKNSLELVKIASATASAGMTDTTTAVRGLSALMNTYNQKSLKDAIYFSNQLFQVIFKGITSFELLSNNLGASVSEASALGVKFKEIGALYITLTKAGISTAEAETAIASLFRSLRNPTEASKESAKALGIQWNALAVQTKGLNAVLSDLFKATANAPDLLGEIVPEIRGSKALIQVLKNNVADYNKALSDMSHAQDGVGATNKALNEQMQSFWFTLAQLKSKLEDLKIEYGLLVNKGLTPLIDKIMSIIDFFRYLDSSTKELTLKIGSLLFIFGSLSLALKGLIFIFSPFVALITGSLIPSLINLITLLGSARILFVSLALGLPALISSFVILAGAITELILLFKTLQVVADTWFTNQKNAEAEREKQKEIERSIKLVKDYNKARLEGKKLTSEELKEVSKASTFLSTTEENKSRSKKYREMGLTLSQISKATAKQETFDKEKEQERILKEQADKRAKYLANLEKLRESKEKPKEIKQQKEKVIDDTKNIYQEKLKEIERIYKEEIQLQELTNKQKLESDNRYLANKLAIYGKMASVLKGSEKQTAIDNFKDTLLEMKKQNFDYEQEVKKQKEKDLEKELDDIEKNWDKRQKIVHEATKKEQELAIEKFELNKAYSDREYNLQLQNINNLEEQNKISVYEALNQKDILFNKEKDRLNQELELYEDNSKEKLNILNEIDKKNQELFENNQNRQKQLANDLSKLENLTSGTNFISETKSNVELGASLGGASGISGGAGIGGGIALAFSIIKLYSDLYSKANDLRKWRIEIFKTLPNTEEVKNLVNFKGAMEFFAQIPLIGGAFSFIKDLTGVDNALETTQANYQNMVQTFIDGYAKIESEAKKFIDDNIQLQEIKISMIEDELEKLDKEYNLKIKILDMDKDTSPLVTKALKEQALYNYTKSRNEYIQKQLQRKNEIMQDGYNKEMDLLEKVYGEKEKNTKNEIDDIKKRYQEEIDAFNKLQDEFNKKREDEQSKKQDIQKNFQNSLSKLNLGSSFYRQSLEGSEIDFSSQEQAITQAFAQGSYTVEERDRQIRDLSLKRYSYYLELSKKTINKSKEQIDLQNKMNEAKTKFFEASVDQAKEEFEAQKQLHNEKMKELEIQLNSEQNNLEQIQNTKIVLEQSIRNEYLTSAGIWRDSMNEAVLDWSKLVDSEFQKDVSNMKTELDNYKKELSTINNTLIEKPSTGNFIPGIDDPLHQAIQESETQNALYKSRDLAIEQTLKMFGVNPNTSNNTNNSINININNAKISNQVDVNKMGNDIGSILASSYRRL